MICALGLREQLVGVSHECDHPPDVAALPRVTSSILPHGLDQAEIDRRVTAALREGRSLYEVDAKLLVSLRPDVVVTQGLCDVCAVNDELVATTMGNLPRSLDARVLSLEGRSWRGILDDARRLGAELGADPEPWLGPLEQRWSALSAGPRTGRRVALLEWPDPAFTGGHWVPEQIAAAGGLDILGAPGLDSRRIPWAEVVHAAPDFLASIACGYDLEQNLAFARALRARPELRDLPAVQTGSVWAFDANSFFSRPTPRLLRGAELLALALQGQSVPGASARA